MDPLMQFLTWEFMLFSLAVAGVTFVLRLIVEYFVKNMKSLNIWEDLILPIFPLVLGSCMGWLMKHYPYPDGLVSVSGRVIFGMVAGMFSGFVYRAIKALLNAKINAPTQSTQNPPTLPPPPTDVSQDVIDSARNSIVK